MGNIPGTGAAPNPPRRINALARHRVTARDVVVALVSGLLVLSAQALIDARRDAEADRRENLRFVRQLAADGKVGQVSLQTIDLTGRNLSGLKLTDAQLSGADLIDADLVATDLTDARLLGAKLRKANLTGALLAGAQLNRADLSKAYLEEANLTGASFFHANLSGAVLTADLVDQPQAHREHSGGTDFTGADLSEATISADLSLAKFDSTKLYGADLTGAKLPTALGPQNEDPGGFPHEPRGHLVSVCYDDDTTWPEGFPVEKLPDVQCPEMKD